MELLEKNHDFISDGTYLAFRYFIEYILPEFLAKGLTFKQKTIYIPISNREDGVYVGEHYLGKIFYPEFISYIYNLPSYKGFKLPNLSNVINNFSVPFDLKQLITDYYDELQKEEYPIFNKRQEDNKSYSIQELTDLACENFEKNILKNIITNSFADKYEMIDVLDIDGITSISRILYLDLEIVNDELIFGGYNIGRVDVERFLNFLFNLPGYIGKIENNDFRLSFDLDGLISHYNKLDFSR